MNQFVGSVSKETLQAGEESLRITHPDFFDELLYLESGVNGGYGGCSREVDTGRILPLPLGWENLMYRFGTPDHTLLIVR